MQIIALFSAFKEKYHNRQGGKAPALQYSQAGENICLLKEIFNLFSAWIIPKTARNKVYKWYYSITLVTQSNQG